MHSFRSITQALASGGAGTSSITKPSGVISGDMLIAVEVADPSTTLGAMDVTGGASWTPLASGTTNAVWKASGKYAGGSEPGSYSFTWTPVAGRSATCVIIAIQNPMGFNPVITVDTPAFGASLSAPSFNPYTANDMDLRFMLASSGYSGVTQTRTPVSDGFTLGLNPANDKVISAYYKNLASMAPAGLATWNTSAAISAVMISVQIPAGPYVPSFTGWGIPL